MTFIAKFENVSVWWWWWFLSFRRCRRLEFVLLADPWDGMDIMLPPRRIVDLFVVQVPSSQNAIVSDMEMKPGHLSVSYVHICFPG